MSGTNAKEKKQHFSSAYDQYYRPLYVAFLKMIKDEATTKDILQEAFLKLWSNWDHVDTSIDMMPLIYTYAKNIYLNEIRSRKTRKRYLQPGQNPEQAAGADEVVAAKETWRKIERSVEKMPRTMKKVFVMSRFEYLKNEDIARRLSISSFTVKRHIQDALSIIKKEVSKT